MNFVPEAAPLLHAEGFAHWFVFYRETLLVCLQDGGAAIPFTADGPVPEPDIIRKVYLGRLDGCPCYAAEVLHDKFILPGMKFLGLRMASTRLLAGLPNCSTGIAPTSTAVATAQGQKLSRMSMKDAAPNAAWSATHR
jgi:hypothetical protein